MTDIRLPDFIKLTCEGLDTISVTHEWAGFAEYSGLVHLANRLPSEWPAFETTALNTLVHVPVQETLHRTVPFAASVSLVFSSFQPAWVLAQGQPAESPSTNTAAVTAVSAPNSIVSNLKPSTTGPSKCSMWILPGKGLVTHCPDAKTASEIVKKATPSSRQVIQAAPLKSNQELLSHAMKSLEYVPAPSNAAAPAQAAIQNVNHVAAAAKKATAKTVQKSAATKSALAQKLARASKVRQPAGQVSAKAAVPAIKAAPQVAATKLNKPLASAQAQPPSINADTIPEVMTLQSSDPVIAFTTDKVAPNVPVSSMLAALTPSDMPFNRPDTTMATTPSKLDGTLTQASTSVASDSGANAQASLVLGSAPVAAKSIESASPAEPVSIAMADSHPEPIVTDNNREAASQTAVDANIQPTAVLPSDLQPADEILRGIHPRGFEPDEAALAPVVPTETAILPAQPAPAAIEAAEPTENITAIPAEAIVAPVITVEPSRIAAPQSAIETAAAPVSGEPTQKPRIPLQVISAADVSTINPAIPVAKPEEVTASPPILALAMATPETAEPSRREIASAPPAFAPVIPTGSRTKGRPARTMVEWPKNPMSSVMKRVVSALSWLLN